MSFASACQEYEDIEKAKAEILTFGHLAPQPHIQYPGWILFTQSAYGDLIPIDTEFKTLPDSPWFYDDLQTFIGDHAIKPGRIYFFKGYYWKNFNGTFRFTGKIRLVPLKMLVDKLE